MAQELSLNKLSRMFHLFFQGYTQSAIARKIKVNQSTVSRYVNAFNSSIEEKGVTAAAKELGIMDEIHELHNLASELKKSKLSVEEAIAGIRIIDRMQALGITEEKYHDVLLSLKRMESEGFVTSAIKLTQLEQNSGMSYEEVCARFVSNNAQLQEIDKNVQIATKKLGELNAAIGTAQKDKKKARNGLKLCMKQTGLDINRLQRVEKLALALKKAKVKDSELEGYIQRQQSLDTSGISLEYFDSILKEVAMVTAHDGGKEFLDRLSEYGGLVKAINGLEAEAEAINKQVANLEQKAKLKASIGDDVAKLKNRKAALEKTVTAFSKQKEELTKLQEEVKSLDQKRSQLQIEIDEKEKHVGELRDEIETLDERLGNLNELETRQQSASANLAEIESRLEQRRTQLEVVESFIGFIDPSSFEQVDGFVSSLPSLIAQAREGAYSPQLLRNLILKNLTGGKLRSLVCRSCDARFAVDKPERDYFGYHCPVCGSSVSVQALKDESAVLKEALAPPKKVVPVPRKVTRGPEEAPAAGQPDS